MRGATRDQRVAARKGVVWQGLTSLFLAPVAGALQGRRTGCVRLRKCAAALLKMRHERSEFSSSSRDDAGNAVSWRFAVRDPELSVRGGRIRVARRSGLLGAAAR